MQEPGDGERRPSTLNHSVMVGAVGNFVECFDWFAYALFASYISRQVFPAGDPLAGLLSTFAIFAVGFFVRPVGSFIFGIYTDRHGRKNALAATIFLMAAGSLMIAVVPTFAQAGWLSPAMLIAARLLQGLAMGGETSAGGSYIVEASPARHRGFSGSFFYISVGLGTLSASLAGSLLTQLLTPAQMESVGWRLVFVLGAALGLFGLYMRRSAAESELFLQVAKTTRKKDRGSLRVVAAEYWPSMLRLFLVAIGPTMALYIWVGYVPNILRAKGLVSAATTFSASTLGLIVYAVHAHQRRAVRPDRPPPGAGRVVAGLRGAARADDALRDGRCRIAALGDLRRHGLIGLGSGAVAAGFAEQFPTRVRAIGWGAPYNISIAVFGARRRIWAHGSPARAGRICSTATSPCSAR